MKYAWRRGAKRELAGRVRKVGLWPHSAETASLPRMSIEAEQLHTGSDWHFRNDEP